MEDNQHTIALAKNPASHARTKHINFRHHYIRETVQCGVTDLQYCPTQQICADQLAKSMSKGSLKNYDRIFGIQSIN